MTNGQYWDWGQEIGTWIGAALILLVIGNHIRLLWELCQ
jgi:hypothetical protein